MIKNNKKKIAVGVAIVVASVAWSLFKPAPAEAAEINAYGSLNYRMGNDEDVNGKSVLKAEDNGSSIGVDISEELVDGISGFAKIELGVDTDDTGSNPFDSKLAYAGLDMGTLGKVSAGRQNSVFKKVTATTDVFPEYGNKAVQKLFSRDSHTVVYSTNIGGLTFDSLAKVDGSTGKSGADVLESTVSFDMGRLTLVAGMSDDKVNKVDYRGLGATYDLSEATTVAFNHTIKETAANLETKANEVAVTHVIGDTTLALGYGEVKDGTAYTTVGATKNITDSFSLYAGYEAQDKIAGSKDISGMSAGIKLTF
jgi:predicted porin